MKNYRPDDWEGIKETNRIKSHDEDWDKEDIFEAGADAMLEVLKNTGSLMSPEQMKLIVPDRKYSYGWLVFIPEEVKE